MRVKKISIKIISLLIITSFTIANPTQALLVDNDRIAINSMNETNPTLANEEKGARDVIFTTLRRLKAKLLKTGLEGDVLATGFEEDARAWARSYTSGAIAPEVFARFLEEGIRTVGREAMELLPPIETAEAPAAAAPEGMMVPIAAIAAPVEPGGSALEEVTGVTHIDAATGDTISSVLSAPVVFDPETVDALMRLSQDRASLDTSDPAYGNKMKILQGLDLMLAETPRQLIDRLRKRQPFEGLEAESRNAFLTLESVIAALKMKGAAVFCGHRGDAPSWHPLGRDVNIADLNGLFPSMSGRRFGDVMREGGVVCRVHEPLADRPNIRLSRDGTSAVIVFQKFVGGVLQPLLIEKTVAAQPQLALARECLEVVRDYEEKERAYGTADTAYRVYAGKPKEQKKKVEEARLKEEFGRRRKEYDDAKSHMKEVHRRNLQALAAAVLPGQDFRINLLDDYLGGQQNIETQFDLYWHLKDFRNFVRIFKSQHKQRAIQALSNRLREVIRVELEGYRQFRERGGRLSSRDLRIFRERMQKLEDMEWILRKEIGWKLPDKGEAAATGNIPQIMKLGNIEADAGQVPDALVKELRSLNTIFGAIDRRLETRGRDSLGITATFTFRTSDEYEAFLDRLEPQLRSEFEERVNGSEYRSLVNRAIRVRRGTTDQDPVSVTFAYKVAKKVGPLGYNSEQLRAYIRNDPIVQILMHRCLSDVKYTTKIIHTRWASAGEVSRWNCHPVDNGGFYTHEATDDKYETIWQIPASSMYPSYGGPGNIYVVLNGDIDNYNREQIIGTKVFPNLTREYREGVNREIDKRVSTDTKLIPLRIEHYLGTGFSLLDAFRLACNDFAGSFAIQMTSDLEPGKIFLAQKGEGQKLYIGISADGLAPSSELYGFIEETQDYIPLESGQIAVVDQAQPPRPENINWIPISSNKAEEVRHFSGKDVKKTELTSRDIDLGGFPHFLDKEISNGAHMFSETTTPHVEVVPDPADPEKKIPKITLESNELPPEILRKVASGDIRTILITGMGTANSAGVVIASIMNNYFNQMKAAGATVGVEDIRVQITVEDAARAGIIPEGEAEAFRKQGRALEVRTVDSGLVIEVIPQVSTELCASIGDNVDMSDTLVIAISQSGGTADTNTFLAKACSQGASLLGIINKSGSDAVRMIESNGGGVLLTGTGRDVEIAVASTMAYYSQVAAGTIYAMKFANAMAEGIKDPAARDRVMRSLVFDIEEGLLKIPELMQYLLQGIRDNPLREVPDGSGQFEGHPLLLAARKWPLRSMHWQASGVGVNIYALLEVIIKLQEECYVTMPGYPLCEVKHINFAAHAMNMVFIANAHGEGGFIDGNVEGEIDKLLAHENPAILVVAENDHRFDNKDYEVTNIHGQKERHPVVIIRVPELLVEKLAPVLSVLAGHKLAYEIAKAMDERAKLIGDVREHIEAIANGSREAWKERIRAEEKRKGTLPLEIASIIADQDKRGLIDAAALRDNTFQGMLADSRTMLEKEFESGRFNQGFDTARATRLLRYFYELEAYRRGELKIEKPRDYFDEFINFLRACEDELARPIDTVREQAKFVTVGTKLIHLSVSDAAQFLNLFADRSAVEKTAALTAFQDFVTGKGRPVVRAARILPRPEEGFFGRGELAQREQTTIAIVAASDPRVFDMCTEVLARCGIKVLSSVQNTYGEDIAAMSYLVEGPPENIDMDALNRAINATLAVSEEEYIFPYALPPFTQQLNDQAGRIMTHASAISAGVLGTAGIVGCAQGVADRPDALRSLRALVRERYCPQISGCLVDRLEALVHWAVRQREVPRRSVVLETEADQRMYYYNVLDGITPALTGEPDSVMYIVYGQGVRQLGNPPHCAANILSAYIPRSALGADAIAQILDPNRRGDQIEGTLDFIARANGFTAHGRPDLSRLQVVVTASPREEQRMGVFEALAQRRGLQLNVLEKGESTFPYCLRSCLPPAQGEPLTVVWTTAGAFQAFASLALTNGLRGSWVSFTLLSNNVGDERYKDTRFRQERQRAMGRPLPAGVVGFGGAFDFTDIEEADIRHLLTDSELKGRTGLNDILSGTFVFTPPIIESASPSGAVMIPLTELKAFRHPESGWRIPGIKPIPEGGGFEYHAIHVLGGRVWGGVGRIGRRDIAIPDQYKFDFNAALASISRSLQEDI